ncbi:MULTISPECIES: hypothetical protein [Nocardia]|uniref:hypothetical protein n=1 Tax=Nocardia TaxID=1817 RepID=UPI0024589278|nr:MULTISPECIES: hypothetical protein [Nocardia]
MAMNLALALHMFTAPVEVLNRQRGPGRNLVDDWWVVDSNGDPLFFHRLDMFTPQCNPHRETVAGMYPGMDVVQLPQVFVPTRFAEGVLRPYAALDPAEAKQE